MSWGRFDDQYAEHPKIREVGPLGMALHASAVLYCARFRTNGKISLKALRNLWSFEGITVDGVEVTSTSLIKTLVEVNLLEAIEDDFLVHDFLEYNPTAQEVEAKKTVISQVRSEAGKKGMEARWHSNNNDIANDASYLITTDNKAHNKQNNKTITPSPSPSPSPTPDPVTVSESSQTGEVNTTLASAQAPTAPSAPDDFDIWFSELWRLYPKKVRKPNAERRARDIAIRDRPLVIQAIENYVLSDKPKHGFVKEPPGFLADEYWRDYVDGPLQEDKPNGQGITGSANGTGYRDANQRKADSLASNARLNQIINAAGSPGKELPRSRASGT